MRILPTTINRFLKLLYGKPKMYITNGSRKKKKVLLLMTGPLRPKPPPPSSLMAVEILECWKKRFKKGFPNGPAIKRRTFFAASFNNIDFIG